MKRSLSFFLVVICLLTVSACRGKKPLDSSAIKSKNALSELKELTRAYESKNLDSFLSNVAEEYKGRESLSRSLADVFDKYKSIQLTLHHAKMIIIIQDPGRIKVSCNWNAEWAAPTGTSQKGGGRATFSFDQNNFMLVAIDGKNPFIPTESTVKQ